MLASLPHPDTFNSKVDGAKNTLSQDPLRRKLAELHYYQFHSFVCSFWLGKSSCVCKICIHTTLRSYRGLAMPDTQAGRAGHTHTKKVSDPELASQIQRGNTHHKDNAAEEH